MPGKPPDSISGDDAKRRQVPSQVGGEMPDSVSSNEIPGQAELLKESKLWGLLDGEGIQATIRHEVLGLSKQLFERGTELPKDEYGENVIDWAITMQLDSFFNKLPGKSPGYVTMTDNLISADMGDTKYRDIGFPQDQSIFS